MASVVEDCGSNGFHAYAVKLEEEHEAKRVMVNPMQCASPAPPSASPAPASPILRRLALLSRFASVCAVAHSHPCIALRLSRIHKRREERTQRIALRPNAPRQKVRPAFANATPSRELCAALPNCLLPCPARHATPCWHALTRPMHLHSRRLSTCRDPVLGSTFTSRGTSTR